jgi:hypothetical protein
MKVYAGNYVINYYSECITTVKMVLPMLVIQAVSNHFVHVGTAIYEQNSCKYYIHQSDPTTDNISTIEFYNKIL